MQKRAKEIAQSKAGGQGFHTVQKDEAFDEIKKAFLQSEIKPETQKQAAVTQTGGSASAQSGFDFFSPAPQPGFHFRRKTEAGQASPPFDSALLYDLISKLVDEDIDDTRILRVLLAYIL
jgi:hypothetical protein